MTFESNLPLQGRRAIVTGGTGGIGYSIVLALAKAGADVAVVARNPARLQAVAKEIEALGRRGLPVSCDITDPEQIERMAAEAGQGLGGVDILVNNAGGAESHKFLDHPDALWHKMIALNMTSTYHVTKAISPLMVEQQWGRIINIASIAAKIGGRYITAYTASKHGVLGFTRALALELIPYNITVNAICPGYVDTPMTGAAIDNIARRAGMSQAKARESLEKVSPQNRLIEPEEVAAVAVMLAQDISKGITGQAINVDGGSVMW